MLFLVFRMAPEVLQPGTGYNFKYVLNIILMLCLLLNSRIPTLVAACLVWLVHDMPMIFSP
jgi:hypothetical protein